ncbi:H-NS histone family protein [Leeia sp. TBRC 13508]|uniref:H-NS histone family protein n=1 Tax=Leeia speluncae TaxID=2884804 RepID=A0ABS8D7K4_9NEIS|nr:H-NS histone family protein [Leeia speluncae]MCB6184186.1 H-NS histone family protein [Leeia speluncae]
MAIQLTDLSFDQLAQLRQDVDKEIQARKAQEASALANLVQERASQLGVSVQELFSFLGKKGNVKKPTGVAKFANPANSAETWTGKGRKPTWFINAVNSGASEDSMRI